jgi:hypothetical protein
LPAQLHPKYAFYSKLCIHVFKFIIQGNKLVKKIDEQINREPVEIFQIKGKMRILRMMQWNGLINEFTRMTASAEPISLTGMELFAINVQFLGAVS